MSAGKTSWSTFLCRYRKASHIYDFHICNQTIPSQSICKIWQDHSSQLTFKRICSVSLKGPSPNMGSSSLTVHLGGMLLPAPDCSLIQHIYSQLPSGELSAGGKSFELYLDCLPFRETYPSLGQELCLVQENLHISQKIMHFWTRPLADKHLVGLNKDIHAQNGHPIRRVGESNRSPPPLPLPLASSALIDTLLRLEGPCRIKLDRLFLWQRCGRQSLCRDIFG